MSHFITALARRQLWWAQGQLGALRLNCINLARLQNNFSDQEIGEEGYFKMEEAIPVEQLSALETTYCPIERDAMLESALLIVRFFRDIAPGMASTHGITYPERLDKVIIERLKNLQNNIGHQLKFLVWDEGYHILRLFIKARLPLPFSAEAGPPL